MNTRPHTPVLIALYRLWCLFCWLVGTGLRVARFHRLNGKQRDAALMGIAQRLLNALNIRLDVNCHAQCPANPPVLSVANHVSWLDIFVLMALYPSGFIAKQSIRHWPVIGTLAARVGTVFINRRSRTDAGNVSQTIAATLAAGQSVTFFPEARTSNGMDVLPFKAALFQAAIDTHTPVQAMALRYYTHLGERCADAAWVDDTSFFTSLWRIARQPNITAQVDFSLLTGAGYTDCADRYQLKDAAEQFIRHKVNQP